MLRATIVEELAEATTGRGDFEFVQLPAQGDRIILPELSGAVGFYRVMRLEHAPVAVNRPPTARPDATVTVYVAWVQDWTPPD
jgi:hypothetical protein